MRAIDYVTRELGLSDEADEEPYGARFKHQPKVPVMLRVPLELAIWLDVLKDKGLGDSRNEVATVLLDAATDQICHLHVYDEVELRDQVQIRLEHHLEHTFTQEI